MSEYKSLSVIDAARGYLARGWYPAPIPPRMKKPMLKGWPALRLQESDLRKHFGKDANIGLILGEASGWLVDVDLDCPEACEMADQYLPPTPAMTGRPSAPNSHRWYIAEGAKTTKHTDPRTRKMIVELRSTGGQTVVGPSIHPDDGDVYDVLEGEPACVPAQMLKACVAALADAVVHERYGDAPPPAKGSTTNSRAATRSCDFATDLDVECRAIGYLDAMPSAISGQGGHSATYAAAVAMVHGFGIEPERALNLLMQHYNPRCEPPWTDKELQHKVEDAAAKTHDNPFGWLRDKPPSSDDLTVDLSAIVTKAMPLKCEPAGTIEYDDPGQLPMELLRVPGFVSEVMDHCLDTAPYPNTVLAFCGAVALQAFLAGRRMRDQADNRTNIYMLGLAHSAAGKDWPRKINTRVLHQSGLVSCLGDQFASGPGLEDAMFTRPCMLFQTDEIDGILRAINKAPDNRHEYMMGVLLRMYSASNSIFKIRRLADKTGKEVNREVDQPCLVVFGTAIPNHYYEALSERMLTNGFLARMTILESGRRSEGQEPKIRDLPPRVLETARWWSDFRPGDGNLGDWHPVPAVVTYTDEALRVLIAVRKEADAQYAKAEEKADVVGTTIWGRSNEQCRKLALLYAVSENHESPRIGVAAAKWARRLVMHQTRRMLFMAQSHVADNPFHALCLKLLQKIRDAPGRTLQHQVALKRMKMDAQSFQKLVQTLQQQGDIDVIPIKTAGRTGIAYGLARSRKGG